MQETELNISDYPLAWITRNIATARAPMSFDELDWLRQQGIDSIVNLCSEFRDLHELEEQAGFEVFWMPIEDETAPSMEQMEKGLEWLDEAVYLGKKVLVHCRHGIGRTGTFVTAYLLRRGFTLKRAGKLLKATRATPTNFSQWWLLRKYGKQEGRLTRQEPTLQNRKNDDLEPLFTRYELLLAQLDTTTSHSCHDCPGCNSQTRLHLIEALYLHTKANITLTQNERQELISLAAESQNGYRSEQKQAITEGDNHSPGSVCPLTHGVACLLQGFRPASCRLAGNKLPGEQNGTVLNELKELSREVFTTVFGITSEQNPPRVDLTGVISGRFIQDYFHYIAAKKKKFRQ